MRKYTFRKYKNLIKRKGITINENQKPTVRYYKNTPYFPSFIGAIYSKNFVYLPHRMVERMKLDLMLINTPFGKLSKLFNIKINFTSNKVLTAKGILVRMGHGKGKMIENYTYLPRFTVIMTVKPRLCSINDLKRYTSIGKFTFNAYFKKYPFLGLKWLI